MLFVGFWVFEGTSHSLADQRFGCLLVLAQDLDRFGGSNASQRPGRGGPHNRVFLDIGKAPSQRRDCLGHAAVTEHAAGYRAFLVGEHLMKSGDPADALRKLVAA